MEPDGEEECVRVEGKRVLNRTVFSIRECHNEKGEDEVSHPLPRELFGANCRPSGADQQCAGVGTGDCAALQLERTGGCCRKGAGEAEVVVDRGGGECDGSSCVNCRFGFGGDRGDARGVTEDGEFDEVGSRSRYGEGESVRVANGAEVHLEEPDFAGFDREGDVVDVGECGDRNGLSRFDDAAIASSGVHEGLFGWIVGVHGVSCVLFGKVPV